MDHTLNRSHSQARRARRKLSSEDAEAMLEMLRRGTIKIVENVEFPLQFSVDVPRLRDVEFINSSLWLTIDGGWFGRAEMSGCRFIDCELDALRVRNANLSSNTFERVVFGGTSMGGVHRTSVDGMRLIDCRVRDHGFSDSTLTRLEVLGGSMSNSNIMDCDLESAVLSTDLDQMNLVRCSFEESDISGSVVGEVGLLDWRSADVRLAKAPSGFLVVPKTARAVLAPILPELSTELRGRLDDLLDGNVPELLSERFFLKTLQASIVDVEILVSTLLQAAVLSLEQVPSVQ